MLPGCYPNLTGEDLSPEVRPVKGLVPGPSWLEKKPKLGVPSLGPECFPYFASSTFAKDHEEERGKGGAHGWGDLEEILTQKRQKAARWQSLPSPDSSGQRPS